MEEPVEQVRVRVGQLVQMERRPTPVASEQWVQRVPWERPVSTVASASHTPRAALP